MNTGGADREPAQSCKTSWLDQLFRKLFFLIPLGVIGNVVFVLIANDGSLLRSGVHFASGYIIIAMFLSITPWFTGSLRLLLWSRFLGNGLRYRDMFRIALGAELGAAISPPLIGGTAVKTCMLMQKGFSGGTALSLTALESMEDGLFFLIMVPLALTLSSSWDLPMIQGLLSRIRHTSLPMFLAGSGVACSVVLVLAQPRSRTVLMRFPSAARLASILGAIYHNIIQTWSTIIFKGKSVFALTFALTAVQWICRYSIISLLLMGFGLPVRPVLYMALQVLVFALMSFIPTPGGAGGAEAVFYLFYRPFLTADSIAAVTMGWRFLTFYFLLLLAAVLFLVMKGTKQELLTVITENRSMPTEPAIRPFVDLED
jgi:glycosyltransferase 2 family protein